MTTVRTEKEFADALNNDAETIEIEGDLANKIIKIRATGKVAWLVAFGAIGIAVMAMMLAPASGGGAGVVGIAAAPVAIGILGASATAAAVSIALAARSTTVLTKMRSYKEKSSSRNNLILSRI
jgi:hypothetical protein